MRHSGYILKFLALCVCIFAFSLSAQAGELMTNIFTFTNLDISITDRSGVDLSGIQDSHEVSIGGDAIESIYVSVNVVGTGSGAYNGDFYAYLTKGDDIAILLNRPGRTATNPFGYPDNGFNIRFSDNAPNGDIHLYDLTLADNKTPLSPGLQLTGDWQPDGRYVSPGLTLDTDPRTHMLNVFDGKDPNGEWTIFFADMEPGGTGMLASWTLTIVTVPEPSVPIILLLGWALLAYCRKRNPPVND